MAKRPRLPINGGYIAGPVYDWLFFLGAPLLGVVLSMLALRTGLAGRFMYYRDPQGAIRQLFLVTALGSILTHAHLAIVVARSHLNRKIFRLYPIRFTVVPVALVAASVLSQWIFVLLAFLAFWWDVFHSSLQTFGLGRIYDQRMGNDPNIGRRADFLFNLLAYSGPIFGGVNLAWHLASFDKFRSLDAESLVRISALLFTHREGLRWVMVGLGVLGTAAYCLYYWRLIRAGYRVPKPKALLFFITTAVSVTVWGFGSFGDSIFVMNFLHAWQYFGIVWWAERSNLSSIFFGKRFLALGALVIGGLAYGIWRGNPNQTSVFLLAIGNVVALMHFWYDGFIWSVRKGQV